LCKRIEQTGLADIGSASYHHRQSVAQSLSLPGSGQHPIKRLNECGRSCRKGGIGQKVDLLLTEIERRFQPHP